MSLSCPMISRVSSMPSQYDNRRKRLHAASPERCSPGHCLGRTPKRSSRFIGSICCNTTYLVLVRLVYSCYCTEYNQYAVQYAAEHSVPSAKYAIMQIKYAGPNTAQGSKAANGHKIRGCHERACTVRNTPY